MLVFIGDSLTVVLSTKLLNVETFPSICFQNSPVIIQSFLQKHSFLTLCKNITCNLKRQVMCWLKKKLNNFRIVVYLLIPEKVNTFETLFKKEKLYLFFCKLSTTVSTWPWDNWKIVAITVPPIVLKIKGFTV